MGPEDVGNVTTCCVLQPLWSVYTPAGLSAEHQSNSIMTTNGSALPLKQEMLWREVLQGLLRAQQPSDTLKLSVHLPVALCNSGNGLIAKLINSNLVRQESFKRQQFAATASKHENIISFTAMRLGSRCR